jgi:hypothetical protein
MSRGDIQIIDKIVKGILLSAALILVAVTLLCGCNGKSLAERNKKFMESLEKEGVGNPANRNRYNNEEYREGYDAGYKNGYIEGKGDYERGEDFTPSSMSVETGNAKYDEGFRTGNLDGYFDAYEDCIRTDEEAKQLATSGQDTAEKDKKPEGYTSGSEYDEGYEIGYDRGYKTGKKDKEAGLSYNPSPHTSDIGGSEEKRQGAADGYKDGYEEGYYSDY